MEGCPEPLEMIFQKIEQESKERAERQLSARHVSDSVEDRDVKVGKPAAATLKRIKDRRRGSISISRVGQLPEDDVMSKTRQVPLTPTAMTIASKSSFYKTQLANGSTTSVASGASAYSDELAHTEDDNHVTQMHHIAGKPNKIIPRRLSRAHSTSIIPTRGNNSIEAPVVIGVSIQQATVKTARGPEDSENGPVTRSRQGSVHAASSAAIRHQPSRSTLPHPPPPTVALNWFSKAKDFTFNFRRKNRLSSVSGHQLHA